MVMDETRIWVEIPLLKEIEKNYPETKGMTYAGKVDWALRKLLENKKKEA